MSQDPDQPHPPKYTFDDDSSLVGGVDNRLMFDDVGFDAPPEEDSEDSINHAAPDVSYRNSAAEEDRELPIYADPTPQTPTPDPDPPRMLDMIELPQMSEPPTPQEEPPHPLPRSPPPEDDTLPLPKISPPPPSIVMADISAMTSVIQFEVDRRRYLRRWLQAVVYFVLVVVITLLHTDIPDAHRVATTMEANFVSPSITTTGSQRSLHTIGTVADVHLWLQNVWAPAIFPTTTTPITATSTAHIATYNRVAVNPYLRMQKRGVSSNCDQYIFSPGYCREGESTATMVVNGRRYTPVDSLSKPTVAGDNFYAVFRVNTNGYGGEGNHTVVDGSSITSVVGVLQQLEADRWFDEESKFLEVPLIMYNAQYDLLAAYKLVFEVTEGGSVVPDARGSVLQVTRLDWYTTDKDKARSVLEIIFMIATFVEAVVKAAHVRRARRRGASVLAYFTSRTWAWNWFEILYVGVALAAFSLHTKLIVDQPTIGSDVMVLDGRVDTVSELFAASKAVNTVLIALCGVKVVRYFGFVPGWQLLFLTIEKALPTLLTFLLLLFILGLGFSSSVYFVFGTTQPSFGATLQNILSFYGTTHTHFTGPTADITYGVFPVVWYWLMFIVMVLVAVGMVVGISVAAHKAAANELKELAAVRAAAKKWQKMAPRKEWWYKAPGTSVVDYFPKSLLEVFGTGGKKWIVPLMVDYKATSKLVAEVGGGNLRVYISVQKWFRRKLVGARGFAVTMPRGALLNTVKNHKGFLAKVKPGQALHLTAEPLVGASEIEFVVEGNCIRTKGDVDLGIAGGREVVIEFPKIINEHYQWPNSEVVVSVDTVHRLATYGGCFTYTPADWIVCSVAAPSSLDICPYLVREPYVPLSEVLLAIEHSGLDIPSTTWKHSITSLAQMFSKTIEAPQSTHPSSYTNPLDAESFWKRDDTVSRYTHHR